MQFTARTLAAALNAAFASGGLSAVLPAAAPDTPNPDGTPSSAAWVGETILLAWVAAPSILKPGEQPWPVAGVFVVYRKMGKEVETGRPLVAEMAQTPDILTAIGAVMSLYVTLMMDASEVLEAVEVARAEEAAETGQPPLVLTTGAKPAEMPTA